MTKRYDRWYQSLRFQVLRKLGGKCSHCGYMDWRALQIDHVNGGGTYHSARVGYEDFLLAVLKDNKGDYQLLCANCNTIKKYEKSEGCRSITNEEILAAMESFHKLEISLC